MKTRVSIFIICFLLIGFVLIVSGCQSGETEVDDQVGTTYKIGFAPGVTGGGSFLGEPERNVAEIIASQLADSGGIVGPDGVRHPVEIIIGDTETNPDVAVSVARRYIEEDEVVAVIAGSVTPISLAIAEVAEEAEVPYISMASSLAIVTDPNSGAIRPWVFKVAQSNGDVAARQVERVQTLGATSVCYLYENTGYGNDCFNNSSTALTEAGFETVFEDSFERSDTEFPQIVGVQAAGCDVVVVGAIPPGASLVTIALRDSLPDVPIIHGHGVCTDDFITTAGSAAEGNELPCSPVIIAEDLPDDHPQKEVFTEFSEAYVEKTGDPVSTFGGHGWDSLNWVIDALKTLPEGTPLEEQRAIVRDYIENNIREWPGTAGIFNLSADDHYGLTPDSFSWFKVENETFAQFPEEDW